MTSSPQRWVRTYLAALLSFLLLDACWLTWMGPRLYRPALASLMTDEVNVLAAGLFYPVYVLGLLVFAIAPALASGRAAVALARGALFGLVAYATYDLTNQATLRGWPWLITAADLAWGAVASAVASAVAAWIARTGTCPTSPPTNRTRAR